jgi:signal recognition particle receptor subunit beta
MVFFNYATMQMAAKIAYYGPGLCGKTTNLHWIYAKTSPQSRGEMVSLETETDRTLFFDLLPIDVGVIGGFKTRLQLYTVPGQVFYNTTRKLVLKGVDGIVFVADSQRPTLEANRESLKNLRENLVEMGLNLDEIPIVLQLNKRDLPNIAEREEMLLVLDPEGQYEAVEASAVKGTGVFETLKTISKLTLRTLRKRMSSDEPVRPAPKRPPAEPSPLTSATGKSAPLPPPAAPPLPATAAAASRIAPPAIGFTAPVTAAKGWTGSGAGLEGETAAVVTTDTPAVVTRVHEEPPVFAAPVAVGHAPAPVAAPPEEKSAKAVPEVKHVKVRSSIDIMAELEALRKRATQSPAKPKKEPVPVAPPLNAREVFKALSIQTAPGVADKTRRIRLTVSFEDDQHEVVQKQDQFLEWQGADVQSLLVNLKIDLDR